jgi:hypothetical protein
MVPHVIQDNKRVCSGNRLHGRICLALVGVPKREEVMISLTRHVFQRCHVNIIRPSGLLIGDAFLIVNTRVPDEHHITSFV